jgi:hypothetical protein
VGGGVGMTNGPPLYQIMRQELRNFMVVPRGTFRGDMWPPLGVAGPRICPNRWSSLYEYFVDYRTVHTVLRPYSGMKN